MIFVAFTYLDNGIQFAVRRDDVKGILGAPGGTAVTMKDGSVFIVRESFEEVLKKCNPPESLFSSYCCMDTENDDVGRNKDE